MSKNNPISLYQSRVDSGELRYDIEQEKAAMSLARLHDDLTAPNNGLAFWKKQTEALGVYMHGGVGRGKSMLMDLFISTLPDKIKARRVHFHEFMIETHEFLFDQRKKGDDVNNALPRLAAKIAKETDVLCFDEFHVTDIADAMILGRLFTHVFAKNVTVVATSNWDPDRLYDKGLQRDLFLPFIELLKTRVEIVHLDSPNDFRTQFDASEGVYLTPLSKEIQLKADDIFTHLSEGKASKSDVIEIKGRSITIDQTTDTIARMSFAQLCERPHGAEDYLALAERYKWIFIENIPRLGYDRRNEAKRFMILIDALYEAKCKVIFTAQSAPEKLYTGDDHAYEFERTISRLNEMQSEEYLAS